MHSCKYFAAKELSAQLIPTYSPAFFPSLYLYIRYDEIFGAAKPLKSETRPPNFFFFLPTAPDSEKCTCYPRFNLIRSYELRFLLAAISLYKYLFSHRSGMLTMSRINTCIYKWRLGNFSSGKQTFPLRQAVLHCANFKRNTRVLLFVPYTLTLKKTVQCLRIIPFHFDRSLNRYRFIRRVANRIHGTYTHTHTHTLF